MQPTSCHNTSGPGRSAPGEVPRWSPGPGPHQVFLEGANEALGDTVAFGLTLEGRRCLNSQKGGLLLEVVRHGVRAMIVTHLQFGVDVLGDGAEVLSHALADRLHGLSRDGAVRWEIS